MNHAERTHALFSPSSAHRWLACPGSVQLEQQFPDNTSSSAEEGTLAHELAEIKLRNYFFTKEYGKRKLNADIKKLKENPLWDDEMLDHTDTYVDYIKGLALSFDAPPSVIIENQVRFDQWIPEGSGTADCILITGNTLCVIDFKYGKSPNGKVEAEHNPQLMLYALGAYEAYRMFYPIELIHLSIVQPRLSAEASVWACTAEELLAFANTAKEKAEEALSENAAFDPGEKTCRYCRARAQCRARADYNVQMAFRVDRKPPLITNDEVGRYLQQGEDVAKWLSDLKDYALRQCLAGKAVPGWKAVEGRGSRDWIDMDKAFSVLQDNGVEEALLWERKPVSLAQIEKLVGKKDFAAQVGDLVVKQPGKPTLVPESDKREAITNQVTAEEAFKEEE